jgi:hypothetical protein
MKVPDQAVTIVGMPTIKVILQGADGAPASAGATLKYNLKANTELWGGPR